MSTSKANESGERKRKRERKRTREAVTVRQREAGSARFDPGLFAFFFRQQSIFLFSQFFKPQSWHTGGCNFAQPQLSISISVRAVRLVFDFVFIERSDLVLSNRIHFV